MPSIIADGSLWCDAEIARRTEANADSGTTIGMNSIKQRRLTELTLSSHPSLYVGQCVPFYFCPRSIMLYVIQCANHPELSYRGGQGPILHLEADMQQTVGWADRSQRRWAFTLSNAGAYYLEDRADLALLHELDWAAIDARDWRDCKEGNRRNFSWSSRFRGSLSAVSGSVRDRSMGKSGRRWRRRTTNRISQLGRSGTTDRRQAEMVEFKTGNILTARTGRYGLPEAAA